MFKTKKKVLIVTYYWPPAGGPGVQRVLKFVKYLPEYGWEPIVLTVKNGEYPAIDESLVKEIPEGTKVYYTEVFSPLKIYKWIMGIKGNIPTHVLSKSKNESWLKKLFKWVRVNIYVPDGRKDWINVITKEGKKVIDKEKPQIIFSTSPPHSVQLGAKKLAISTGLKWVVDMRDPWTDGFWLKSLPRTSYAQRKDSKLELSVLSKADSVTTISETWVKMFMNKVENKYHALPNGYDQSDFDRAEAKKSTAFKIVHSGSLRESQIPTRFFEDLKELIQNGYGDIELHCFGSLHPDAISLIEELGISDHVIRHGYVNHSVIISELKGAQVLLMLVPDTEDNKGILPGKLFEYIGSGNYILGIGPRGGEAESIISEYGNGAMLSFSESGSNILKREYENWKMGIPGSPDIDVSKYSRRFLTKKLADIFNELT